MMQSVRLTISVFFSLMVLCVAGAGQAQTMVVDLTECRLSGSMYSMTKMPGDRYALEIFGQPDNPLPQEQVMRLGGARSAQVVSARDGAPQLEVTYTGYSTSNEARINYSGHLSSAEMQRLIDPVEIYQTRLGNERVDTLDFANFSEPVRAILACRPGVSSPNKLPRLIGGTSSYAASRVFERAEIDQVPAARVRLEIGADGRPTSCSMLTSSGSPATDALICDSSRRLRFEAATDARGQIVASTLDLDLPSVRFR